MEGAESCLGSLLTVQTVIAGVTSPVAVEVKLTRTDEEELDSG